MSVVGSKIGSAEDVRKAGREEDRWLQEMEIGRSAIA